MSLLTIAELLAGEAVITPGGPVDRNTAIGDDERLWGQGAPAAEVPSPAHSGEQTHTRTKVPRGRLIRPLTGDGWDPFRFRPPGLP